MNTNVLILFILSFSFSAFYTYTAFVLYRLLKDLGASKITNLMTSIFWLPCICIIISLILFVCLLIVAFTPIFALYILVVYTYRKIIGKTGLFDIEEVNFEL